MLTDDRRIFFIFLLFRLVSVYIVRSSFVPDEYWQSLEVSHRLTYGYGHLTWEWDKQIRSCFYPFIIHLFYCILPDSTFFIVYSPKLLQALLSSVGDFFAYKLAKECFGKGCGFWTAFNILTSWFLFYCSPRNLTNMAEASLTSIGLYFYPWPQKIKSRSPFRYIWFAGISTVIRPTACVLWFLLYVWHIMRERNFSGLLWATCLKGLFLLCTVVFIDMFCYGNCVFTPYKFFLFNWSNDIGAFYGSHDFLWYFYAGLPTVLGLHLIPFMCGLMLPQLKQFYLLILWFLFIFSILSHKEFRFLLPILHICMIVNGVVMNELWNGRLSLFKIKLHPSALKYYCALLILLHVPVCLYMGLFHQRGVIDAALHLSKTATRNSSILFLMPCHSTPYYSYIHKNIEMKFLTCEPNFKNDENYMEEAEYFYQDPTKWLFENYESNSSNSLPSYIVMFDTLYSNISKFLRHNHYEKCYHAFHSHFAQGRTGNSVYIYCNLYNL